MRNKIIGLFLLSLLIICMLAGLISYSNKDLTSSLKKYDIDTNNTFYINANNCNYYPIKWDNDYVEVYSTTLFNVIYKNKPYTIGCDDNKLNLEKTICNRISFLGISTWSSLKHITKYITNDTQVLSKRIDFIIYYPKNIDIKFTGNKTELKF
ncbi:hypothetical protein AN1V17_22090 [Vallitalea sediminicola]